jgi:hypothetical protein
VSVPPHPQRDLTMPMQHQAQLPCVDLEQGIDRLALLAETELEALLQRERAAERRRRQAQLEHGFVLRARPRRGAGHEQQRREDDYSAHSCSSTARRRRGSAT